MAARLVPERGVRGCTHAAACSGAVVENGVTRKCPGAGPRTVSRGIKRSGEVPGSSLICAHD